MLPKFILGDNYTITDKVFVIHTQYPRCIIECGVENFYDRQNIHWLDPEFTDQNDLDSFMAEAEQYFNKEFEDLEANYNESLKNSP